ncbi:uncharacterized protein YciI [Clostridium punense]|uniref:Uncharacterized protein YciI n=1 Tax=Clostridium punense TaxID=1054297 RepID=A0ABS4K891_9CLOT|nr:MULTISPECIES: YciI family protein [Clostridium]EQB89633.1 hypothetical protein M918_19770 [Clostridium sp. BL8]MBP2024002.1 uncharacterized protein YciI [Clostridium punense]
MQFLVTGYDGKDENALERRLTYREEHLALAASMKESKNFLCAAALVDEKEQMIGSVLMVDFPSREDLDKWLAMEPYVKGNVWQTIEVKPCKVAPLFMK